MSNPKSESSGPPFRAFAMLFISLAVVFAGLGLASLGSGDSNAAESPDTAATETTTAAAVAARSPAQSAPPSRPPTSAGATTTSGASSTTTSSAVAADVPVRVFNNSPVAGLAAETAQKLTSAGWTVAETGNYSDTTVAATTVYYGNSATEREAAEDIADVLGVSAKPRLAGLAESSSGVIVIVTND